MAKITNPIGGFFESGRKASQGLDVERAKKKQNRNFVMGIGLNEANIYQSGKPGEKQQARLDEISASSKAEAERTAQYAGLNKKDVDEYVQHHGAIVERENQIAAAAMSQDTLSKALNALDISVGETTQLIASYQAEQNNQRRAAAGLFTTVALITAAIATGNPALALMATASTAQAAGSGSQGQGGQ